MRRLLSRLPGILDGKAEPQTPDEACEFARLCAQKFQRRYADAVRLFEKAFAAATVSRASRSNLILPLSASRIPT